MKRTCQRGRGCGSARRPDPEEAIAKVRAAADEMTVKRYVHTGPGLEDGAQDALWSQLWALNQVLDCQNQILSRVLSALERLTQAAEGQREQGKTE